MRPSTSNDDCPPKIAATTAKRPCSIDADRTGIVADGYERAVAAIEAKVRPEVEQRYAEEWNSSGLLRRWRLHKEIEREVKARVAERAKHLSEVSLF